MSVPGGGRWKEALLEALVVLACGALAGILSNHLSTRLPLTGGLGGVSVPVLSRLALPQAREIHAAGSMAFVDARRLEDFVAGHVPGAVSLSPEQLEAALPAVEERLHAAGGVVVYCDQESGEPSQAVAEALARQGFHNLYLFPGGWSQWQAAGLRIEEGEP